MADYRIESDGSVVVYLSEKATKWDASTDEHIWAETYDRDLRDVASYASGSTGRARAKWTLGNHRPGGRLPPPSLGRMLNNPF